MPLQHNTENGREFAKGTENNSDNSFWTLIVHEIKIHDTLIACKI